VKSKSCADTKVAGKTLDAFSLAVAKNGAAANSAIANRQRRIDLFIIAVMEEGNKRGFASFDVNSMAGALPR
jgi:hypothetical protein